MKAENGFHEAVKNVPTGSAFPPQQSTPHLPRILRWDLVGMQALESLSALAVAAGNSPLSQVTLSSQLLNAGLGAFKNSSLGSGDKAVGSVQLPTPPATTAPNGIATLGYAAALSDPGLMAARSALDMANNTQHLVEGGPDGKPNWTNIRGRDGVRDCIDHGASLSDKFENVVDERLRIR